MFFGEADLSAGRALGADRFDREPVGEHGVMADLLQLGIRQAESGCGTEVDRLAATDLHVESLVAAFDEGGELVDREVVLDPVAELLRDVAGVVGEGAGGVLGLPAAVLDLQGLREVPVAQRREGLDAGCEQFVDEAVVEVNPPVVRLAGAVGEDPWPGDREPVGGGTDVLHQRDVFLVSVVVVVGHITVLVVLDVAGCVGVRVPDGRALAVLVPRAFDLVRRRRDAPAEPIRKAPLSGR